MNTYYLSSGAFTRCGRYQEHFEGLPGDVAALCGIVQGLLIHDHYGLHLYGPPPSRIRAASRETIALDPRLDQIFAADSRPITVARPPFERSVGTCRDYALLLCAMLRQQSVPARLRCGFARYFDPGGYPGGYEDHWICEYWSREDHRWRIADAQLDEAHRDHLSIDFDITDIPGELFVFPWRAWPICRSGAAAPFGKGAAVGAWFIRVNLARDLLALHKREVSAWDSWREAPDQDRGLDAEGTLQCDRLAALAEAARGLEPPATMTAGELDSLSLPPWRLQEPG